MCLDSSIYMCIDCMGGGGYYTPYNMPPAEPKAQKNLPKYIYLNFFN